MRFGWSEQKAADNFRDHTVTFAEAQQVFLDSKAIDFHDAAHSTADEQRFNIVGFSARRLLFVVYSELADGTIWLISARKAEAKYRRLYEKEND
jgi:uncharacterized DUF497 family protein